MAVAPAVTLFLPTRNAGAEFPEIFALMQAQRLDRPFEILVIDSGSTDGTVEFLRRQPVRLIEIPHREFNHGGTRNRGIREARGEIVVLATQDARPANLEWMQRLVDRFDDPRVAGAYSRQLPRADANPFIRDRLLSWAASGDTPRLQSVPSREAFEALSPRERMQCIAFDNVSSSVRRSVALQTPFRECAFGEDVDWAYRVILQGYGLAFEPRSAVMHSHDRSLREEFERVYLDHENLHRLVGLHTVPRWRDVLSCTLAAAGHLAGVVARDPALGPAAKLAWWARVVPYSLAQNLAQFLGARAGARDARRHGVTDSVAPALRGDT